MKKLFKNPLIILGGVFAAIYFLNKNQNKGVNGFFDESTIKTLDDLKKQYYKLSMIHHPDRPTGNTQDFQDLQNEYEKLIKQILKGSKLSEEEQKNEIEIDEALRSALDTIMHLDLKIEIIGKWIWVSGNTFPVKETLKAAGFVPRKKGNLFFWVFIGEQSKGRGNMTIEEIRKLYGSKEIKNKKRGEIGNLPYIDFYSALQNLKIKLSKRDLK
jgi:hypothetical protein